MSQHTNYQPGREGFYDKAINRARLIRCVATYRVIPEVKRDLMVAAYGGKPTTEMVTEQAAWEASITDARAQQSARKWSDQGDFTRCYRGGF
jgi:hypothetical protein